jgi:S1-C subfamily serine protease
MAFMLRGLLLATLVLLTSPVASTQTPSVLHIKAVLLDGERKPTPVPHHALLISDNPASAPPRRIVTALDGTVDVKLPPGNYAIESDQPVAFQGKAYQWTLIVDIVAGRDATLELTADNAETLPVTAANGAGAVEPSSSALLMQWQDSVVAIWTPTAHASGFVVDAKGLVITNQRVVGTATTVEVQLTPSLKVAGSVLIANAVKDVAIISVAPEVLASLRPVSTACGAETKPQLQRGQRIFTIGTPLRDQKGITSGYVSRIESHAIVSDLILARGSTGGPVLSGEGIVVGYTSVADEKDEERRPESQAVRIEEACDLIAAAAGKLKDGGAATAAHLPVEPLRPFPADALKEVQRRAGSLNPYQTQSEDYDISFITPMHVYGAQYQSEQAARRERGAGAPMSPPQALVRPLMDFGYWSGYVADIPPVLLVRVTPRLVEGFWTTVARGAARTQGVSLPPIKHFKPGFARMRAFCGDAEVTPIHPLKLEQRVSETDAIYEGLYVFDPEALTPQCSTVTLVLYSEKEPDKGDKRVVDPKIVQQVWEDFAPYRASR